MPTRRIRRIAFSWIALVAILLVTLAPSITGMFPASRGLPWEQVCTAANASASAATSPDSHGSPHAFDHCPYCALHAELAPPPSLIQADTGIALSYRAYPPAFVAARRSNAAWASAQARAPPSFA